MTETYCANCGEENGGRVNWDDTGAAWAESSCCGDALLDKATDMPVTPTREAVAAAKRLARV